jgi:hypothetical protein
MFQLSFTTVAGQNAFVIPDDVVARVRFRKGDVIQAIESPAGLFLCKVDKDTAEQLEIGMKVMDRRRDALRRLAE